MTLAWGCSGDENLIPDTGTAYFPLKKGMYHIYSVEETRYASESEPEVSTYELMTEVVDSFPAAQGTYNYVIHRMRRSTTRDPWQPLDTWAARKEKSEVIVSEGNTPFVKVKFPLGKDTRWNGNAFNTLGEDEYQFLDIHQPMQLNGIDFEKTVTVEQERNEDIIVFRDERREVYALEVGLVYKEVIQLNYCTDDPCLGQQKIDHGIEMKMAIRQYGKN